MKVITPKQKYYYGGWYVGIVNSKWLTLWFSDLRESTVVPYKFVLEVYSKYFGNKTIFKLGKHY